MIAEPFRKALGSPRGEALIPKYNAEDLKESLIATLEMKRRRRIQRNVVAAAIPAFAIATLSVANTIAGQRTESYISIMDWLRAFRTDPVVSFIELLKAWPWALPTTFLLGLLWITGWTGILVPSDTPITKPLAQLLAVRGKFVSVSVFFTMAVILAIWGLYLLRL
jgi:hypothetical protein